MEWVKYMVDRVRAGKKPDVPQLPLNRRDPVSGETAGEAYKNYNTGKTPFVNPFHAHKMDFLDRVMEAVQDEPTLPEFREKLDTTYAKAAQLAETLDGEILEKKRDGRHTILKPVEELQEA